MDQRYDYPLGPGAVVLDVGAYMGNFTRAALEIWRCTVHAFEPVPEFCKHISFGRPHAGELIVHQFGLGGQSGRFPMSIRNDSSSLYVDADHPSEVVTIMDVVEAWQGLGLGDVDLLKLNVEGAEYGLLERMLMAQLMPRVRFLQVQWHGCNGHGSGPADAPSWRRTLSDRINITHEKQWEQGDRIWESWARR